MATTGLAIGVIVPGLFGELAKLGAYRAFEHQQQAFASAADGYPWIRNFAKREYGIDVVLSAPSDAWTRTTLQTIGASPAYMSTGNGLCELSMSRQSLLNGFAPRRKSLVDGWVKGVMQHEFGHCLDSLRDYAGQGGGWTGANSIAPIDRADVHNGPSHYRIGTTRLTTQLWREVLADIMAVGYWRLLTDPVAAVVLTQTLRAKRQQDADTDKARATMCWIDRAISAQRPSADRELFAWDALRSATPCATASH